MQQREIRVHMRCVIAEWKYGRMAGWQDGRMEAFIRLPYIPQRGGGTGYKTRTANNGHTVLHRKRPKATFFNILCIYSVVVHGSGTNFISN